MKSCCFNIVILFIFIYLQHHNLFAQKSILDKEVKLSAFTNSIENYLDEISNECKIEFSYTSKVPVYHVVSISKQKRTIREHLQEILCKDSISFTERNNKILLFAEKSSRPIKPNPEAKQIKGLVVDKKTKKPLPYANVFIINKSIGTISNASGSFFLKLTNIDDTDTLGISYIGYRLFRIPVHEIDTSQLVIRLSSEQVQINEILVRPYDPIYIITKALENIPKNYEQEPLVLTAFFREAIRLNNSNLSLSEAIIKIYKESYTSLRPDQVKIFKGRKSNNTEKKENIDFIVQGGLYNNLQLDIVKNGITFLDKDYFHLYVYAIEKIIYHQDKPTYVISFDQRKGVRYPCYKGRLYIDVESLAIIGATFELSQEGIDYATGIYVKKCPKKLRVKPVSASYEVYYRMIDNRWNLSHARSDVNIKVKHKKDKLQDKINYEYESISEFVITSIDSSVTARFRFNEIARPRDILVEQIKETDDAFWGDENIIIPEEPIEKTVLRLWKKDKIQYDQNYATGKIVDTLPNINKNDE